MSLRMFDCQEVSRSVDVAGLEANLVRAANALDFGLVSAVLMKGEYDSPDFVCKSVTNSPAAFIEIHKGLDQTRADPVMQRLLHSSVPFTYDQRLYVESGAGDVWEAQAPFGYCTGIAVGLRLPNRRHFLIGVDRPKRLPRQEGQLTRMMADLQLLAVHAQHAAQRLFDSDLDEQEPAPHLTPRELECLRWTMEGKSSYVIGRILSVSTSAVNFHLQNAMRKLNVSSKHSAVLRCVSLNIL